MKKLLLSVSAILFLFIFISSAHAAVGKIMKMSGEVSYRTKANIPYQMAKEGVSLEVGYWIKTGKDGWARLSLSDGSVFTLANNTELEIDKFLVSDKKKDGIFNLSQGKLRATITKLAGQQTNYKVKSPTAVAGIKGTEFMMMSQGFANVFFGNEGSAEVSGGSNSGKPLSADTMVQNTRGMMPTDPVNTKEDAELVKAKKGFEEITSATPPAAWDISGNLPHIIARWNVNYGRYLADAGRYEEAIYVFQIALDLTELGDIRGDARLERGAVYSRFLKNSEAALAEYLLVLEEYPDNPQRETALFLTGMILNERGFTKRARERLTQYSREYPMGKHISNVETILRRIKD